MNLKKLLIKKKTVPSNNETKTVDAIQLWRVEWISRNGQFFADTIKEVEVLTNEKDANDFKISLENAFKLLKHTSGNIVKLSKVK